MKTSPLHKSLIAAAVFGLGSVSFTQAAVPFTDNFSTNHNYSSSGVTGTGWDGIFNAGNLGSVSQATGGLLEWRDAAGASHGWENSQHNAPFLYLNVTGDFSAQVEVIPSGVTTGTFATGGLLVADLTGGAIDWMQVTYSSWQNLNRVATTNDNSTTEPANTSIEAFLRIDRTGSTFDVYTKANVGDAWGAPLATIVRGDLPSTLQVGVQFSKFNSDGGLMKYDNFSVVPEPASAMLVMAGAGMLAMRRKRNA